MQLVIDIDLHIVTQGLGSRAPTAPIGFKSQDTPALNIYFVSNGVVQDLGASPTIKFGLVKISDVTDFFSYNATFTKLTDASSNPYYQGFPIFNTSQTVAALGSAASIQALGEIRVTLASGEKFSVLDVPFVIYRTILVDGGTPDPTLIPGYPDVSTIELKTNKGIVSGYAGLDSGGKLLTTVLPVVPLANIPTGVELSANKNAASGYPGLDSSSLILAARIPVDGTTILTAGGKIVAVGPSLGVLGVTLGPFTMPAVGSNVSVPITTGAFNSGSYYIINTAGVMQYVADVDLTHGTFKNIGSALNAAPTTVILTNENVIWCGPPGPIGIAPWLSAGSIAAWSSGATYTGTPPASIVTYGGGTWVALAPVLASHPGAVGGEWIQICTIGATGQGLTWQGAWSSGTAYVPYDIVSLAGSSYICILGHTNHTPPNATYWTVIASIGSTGATGAVGATWQGAWSGGTAYVANDLVASGGNTYICILGHTNHVPPNATYWTLVAAAGSTGATGTSFTWQGAWSGATAYVANDVVSLSGSSYVCILGHTNHTPPNATYWNLIAQIGATGPAGPGSGDMLAAVYDTATRGYVDRAVLADTVTLAPYQTKTSSTFTIPAAGSAVTIAIVSASWPVLGQTVLITDGTRFMFAEVTTVSSGTSIAVTNRGYKGNNVSGTMSTAALVALVGPGICTSTQPGLVPTPSGTATDFLGGDAAFHAHSTIALDTLGAPTDITTRNATSSQHGLLVKVSGTATDFVGGDNACHAHTTVPLDTLGTPTDITTLNASTSAHGLLKKLDNTATHYMDGTGAWSTPPSGSSSIHCRLKRTSVLTYTDSAAIVWTTAEWDTTSMWDSSSKITIATAGYYMITAQAGVAYAGADTGSLFLEVWLNGAGNQILTGCTFGTLTTDLHEIGMVSGVYKLAASDYLQLVGIKISSLTPSQWKSQAAGSFTPICPWFSVDYLGT